MSEQWTTEKPTQPGIYWAFDGESVLPVEVLKVSNSRKSKLIVSQMGFGFENPTRVADWTHWIGPLPEPEPPK